MTDDRWQDIIAHIKDKFEVLDHQTLALAEEAGPGSVEYIEFNGPLGRMKLERLTKPLITGKKTLGSRRIGSETAVSYVYSDTEQTHQFAAFRWDDASEDWLEMSKDSSAMVF